MINVVIDTNVFVSAILSDKGQAIKVIECALNEQIIPQFDDKLFREYESVLLREHIIKQSILSANEIERLLDALLAVSDWRSIYFLFRPNLADESDNHIVELAIASNSRYIITNNTKDFIGGELKTNSEVVTANAFIQKEHLP